MFVRGKAGPKICGANQGDALPAIEEVRPQERHRWETGLQNADPGPDFQREPALRRQKASGMVQDSRRGFHPVSPGYKREPRLVSVLGRKRPQVFLRHIGRIGDDQIEKTFKPCKKIGLDQLHAVPQAMPLHVASRNCQGLGGDIGGNYAAVGECACQGDRNATAARANFEYAPDSGGIQPWLESVGNELRKGRAGNQHPFVHIKRQSGEPGLTRKVWQGATAADARFKHCFDLRPFRLRYFASVGPQGIRVIKPHDMEDERGCLIPRVPGTVAKIRTGAGQTPGT